MVRKSESPSGDDLNNALEVLRNGGIILYPTDTIWGIGGDATKPDVVERILALKKRPAEKSMLILLGSVDEVRKWVGGDREIIDAGIGIMRKAEQPTTVIFRKAANLASNLIAVDGSIGIRIPDEPFCQALLKEFHHPLISTSANLSGEPSPRIFREIGTEIRLGVDYIVEWRQDDERVAAPSRLVSITENGESEILR